MEAKVAFIPLSLGARNCAGMILANLEMMLALARGLFLSDYREPSDEKLKQVGEGRVGLGTGRERPGDFQLWDIRDSHKDGPYLEFRKRESV